MCKQNGDLTLFLLIVTLGCSVPEGNVGGLAQRANQRTPPHSTGHATEPPIAIEPPNPLAPASPPASSLCPEGVLSDLVEDRRVYQQDTLDVTPIAIEVADLAGLTAVNADAPGAEVEAIFREGSFGQDATTPNAELELRGHTTRRALQKSYSIKLKDKTRLWRGQREIHLNKHPFDLTRIRNRLAFDLLRSVPHMTSLRTGMVRLSINGEDLGHYTWIEEVDERFLTAHGLDPNGQLYKARRYQFQPLDPATLADAEKLESIIDDKANPDIDKLQRMATAAADPSLSAKTLLDRFFNRRNYMTWVAFNILTGNFDTNSQNYYLYSPSGCEGWYVLPWDYDGALSFREQPGQEPRNRFSAAFAYWWNSPMHRRILSDPDLVHELEMTIAELASTTVSDAAIAPLLARYREQVRAQVLTPPDLWNLPTTSGLPEPAEAEWAAEYHRLGSVLGALFAESLEARERPMAIHVGTPTIADGIRFAWQASFDLQGDPFTYNLQVSRSARFDATDLIVDQRDLQTPMTSIPLLPAGQYAWRVIIWDNKGNWQLPYDPYQPLEVP